MTYLKKQVIYVLLAWVVLVPFVIGYLSINHLPSNLNMFHLAIFISLAFSTFLFPVKRNGQSLMLISWISVPAFLQYGLLVEMIITQLALLAHFYNQRNNPDKYLNLILNSIIFALSSFAAAAAFYFVGGTIGMTAFWPLLGAVLIYQLFYKIVFHNSRSVIVNLVSKEKQSFPHFINTDLFVVIFILPFSVALYYLIEFLGFGGFILIGIPYFVIVSMIRLYGKKEKINKDLKIATDIGHNLSSFSTEKEVLDDFVKNIALMFKAEFTYLFDHKSGWLELLRSYEYGQFKDYKVERFAIDSRITKEIVVKKQSVIFEEKKDWVEDLGMHKYSSMQSAFGIPISRNEKIEGVLFVFSSKKRRFEKYQVQIADILCSYFTVSVEKARYLENKVKETELCALTNLYNYYYLDERIKFESKRLHEESIHHLSIIMLDIDYFKKVNDTFGHESGNIVLVEVAKILESYVPEHGIVGRYGGEEFVYVLPNVTKEDAINLAERVRVAIENRIFTVIPDLSKADTPLDISITISSGVSSMPRDTDDVKVLVRNADRALYLGAKQAGRNRVAGYIK